jgi:phytoene/squalene synthetase
MNYSTDVNGEGRSLHKWGQDGVHNAIKVENPSSLSEEYLSISKLTYKELQSNPILDIAARVWENDVYQAAQVCYRSLRIFDDLIDNHKKTGPLSSLEKKEYSVMIRDWISGINNSKPLDSTQKELLEVINRFRIPLWPFQKFSKAMLYDINNEGFSTWKTFLRYTEGAAISPASIFVHLCGVEKNGNSYNPPRFEIRGVARPAALYSYLVHIIRDFEKDQKNNLNYFAEDIMSEFGLNSEMLRNIAEGGEINSGFRGLMNRYYESAEFYRNKALRSIDIAGPYLEPRYVISLQIIYDLYLQIFERIDVNNGKFTSDELNPTPDEVRDRLNLTVNGGGLL